MVLVLLQDDHGARVIAAIRSDQCRMIAHQTGGCVLSCSTDELAVLLAQALHCNSMAVLAISSRAGAECAGGLFYQAWGCRQVRGSSQGPPSLQALPLILEALHQTPARTG